MTKTEKPTERRAWSPASERVHTQQRINRACPGNRPALRAFATWLAEVRGLAPGTIAGRLHFASTFVDAITSSGAKPCVSALQSLTPCGVEDFFVRYGQGHGMAARRSMQTAMRSFLRFAASQGWVARELADAVPILSSYRFSNLPSGVSNTELSTLLTSSWKGRCPRRDRAIVYLLTTYGVRREQVSALRFRDISWNDRVIIFAAHKGGKAVQHTLTGPVAEFLSEYIQNERPLQDCDDEYIFLRGIRPYTRLSPGAITNLVGARMKDCGLQPRSPHAFRHAFATRLLSAGESVKVIADLLGHRSLDTVAIYAKVDYNRLLEVAVDWPEVLS